MLSAGLPVVFARACGCNTVCYQVLSVVFGVLSYVSGGFCGVLGSQGLIGGGVPGVWLSPPSRRRLGGSLKVCTVLSRSHTPPHALTGCNPTFSVECLSGKSNSVWCLVVPAVVRSRLACVGAACRAVASCMLQGGKLVAAVVCRSHLICLLGGASAA